MTIRVAELVEQPHLRLELVAGTGGLERTVTWAHASDLPNPWDWLAGGELLMKNGRSLPRSTARQTEFIERLADAAVAALVVGTDPMTPHIAGRAAERADKLGLPVLRVPYSMSFIAISRAVADASSENHARRMARTERIYAAIQTGRSSGGPGDFLGRLEGELGCRFYVLDAASLRPVLPGTRPPDASLKADLGAALGSRESHVPGILHLPRRGRRVVVAVDVPVEERTLLVADRPPLREWDVPMLHHVATAVAVGIGTESLRQDLEADLGAATLDGVLDRSLTGAAADVLLGRQRLDLSACRLVVVRSPPPGAIRRVEIALRRRQVRHLMAERVDGVWVLTDEPSIAVDVLCSRLEPHAPAGTSGVVDSSTRVPEAAGEALFALGVATRRGGGGACFGEVDVVSGVRDPIEARAVVEAVLGPVAAYDRRHGTDLVASLASFLACRRSWSRTAEALHVHRQTVIYRMKRVAELTGRDLAETADLAELWRAVTAHDLLRGVVRTSRLGTPKTNAAVGVSAPISR